MKIKTKDGRIIEVSEYDGLYYEFGENGRIISDYDLSDIDSLIPDHCCGIPESDLHISVEHLRDVLMSMADNEGFIIGDVDAIIHYVKQSL